MIVGWPLVGRGEELEFISGVRARRGRGVLLAGAQGVGKTRLAREALTAAEAGGWAAEFVAVTASAAALPLGPFAALLPRRADPSATPLQLIGEGIAMLLESAGARRLALAVDDAHCLDDASAALLHLLATGRDGPFVLVTVRAGESVPDAVASLWKEGTLERLDLQPLARTETDRLVISALGGSVESRALHHLWAASAGNPLFIRELVLAGQQTGGLVQRRGQWRWVGTMAPTPRLREVVDARLAALGPWDRAVLEAVAVGGPLELALLERLMSAEALEAVEREGLLIAAVNRRRSLMTFGHPLYADILASSVPSLRARAIRRQLADALESLGARRRSDLIRLATWRLDSGSGVERGLLLDAARRSYFGFFEDLAGQLAGPKTGGTAPLPVTRGDEVEQATRLALAALETGDDAEASLALARALVWQDRVDEADSILSALESRPDADRYRAALVEARASLLFWGRGDAEEASAVLAGAEPLERLIRFRAGIAVQSGRPRASLAIIEPLLATPSITPDAVRAAGTAGAALGLSGRFREVLAMVERFMPAALAGAGQDPLAVGDLVVDQFYALRIAGRLEEAASMAQFAYDVASSQDSIDGTSLFAGAIGLIAADQGRLAAAARRFREMDAILQERDGFTHRPWCLGLLASAAAQVGLMEEASAAIGLADELRRGPRFFDTDIELGRAWVRAGQGDVAGAISVAAAAADTAEEAGLLPAAAFALHLGARLGGVVDLGRLTSLGQQMGGDMMPLLARHAVALSRRDAEDLGATASELQRLGMLLVAAEAWAAAAQAYDASGHGARSLTAQARLAALRSQCEGASTPGLTVPAGRTQLTGREQEVARLAASGMSSPAIAERLVLSVRTVESHLYRAFAKLGIQDRSELAAALSTGPDQMQ